jgi:alpha-beta hydrolase superfamily lysophospholipase
MLSALRKIYGLLLSKLEPGWSSSRIDALLLIPKSSTKPPRVPRKFKQFELKSKDGKIHAYQIGKGPTVVFVHGWGGGGAQFFALMQGLAQIGFTAIAFDHLGHGQSEVKEANLQQFIVTTNYMLHHAANKTPDGLYAVVGHSTGCIAIANARPAVLKDVPALVACLLLRESN